MEAIASIGVGSTKPKLTQTVVALRGNDGIGFKGLEGEALRFAEESKRQDDEARRRRKEQPWAYAEGRQLTPLMQTKYVSAMPADGEQWPHSLQLTLYDPGSSAYRYHSAFNTVPGLISMFARWNHNNPYCDLRQIDGPASFERTDSAFERADIVHCHMDYSTLSYGLNRMPMKRQLLVRHYHGSMAPGDPNGPTFVQNDLDAQYGAVQVSARLYHKRYSENMHWVPLPMPILDYADMAAIYRIAEEPKRALRIGHSPTMRGLKGTDFLISVVNELQTKGVKVDLVLIEGMPQAEALRLKASCDVTFDSFWLGIQGSGLEAASMGQVVLAGDHEAKNEYIGYVGECPYTFVEDRKALLEAIVRLIEDPVWRTAEAARVHAYVLKHHDYPAVGRRYQEVVLPALAVKR